MDKKYYVEIRTATGKRGRAGDWRNNSGPYAAMHRQAHRLAHVKASQLYESHVTVSDQAVGFVVLLDGVVAATYHVLEVPNG